MICYHLATRGIAAKVPVLTSLTADGKGRQGTCLDTLAVAIIG